MSDRGVSWGGAVAPSIKRVDARGWLCASAVAGVISDPREYARSAQEVA